MRAPAPTVARPPDDRLAALERRYAARLGIYALATGTGTTVEYRADERFAFCSAFKGLAAAAVPRRNSPAHLDALVRYTRADLLRNAAITPRPWTPG